MASSFTSINGTATITVNDLSEIKYIAVLKSNGSGGTALATAIDLNSDTPHCYVSNSTYSQFGFKGSPSAVSGNTFTWYWNSAVTFYYIAYGK